MCFVFSAQTREHTSWSCFTPLLVVTITSCSCSFNTQVVDGATNVEADTLIASWSSSLSWWLSLLSDSHRRSLSRSRMLHSSHFHCRHPHPSRRSQRRAVLSSQSYVRKTSLPHLPSCGQAAAMKRSCLPLSTHCHTQSRSSCSSCSHILHLYTF